MGRGRGAEFNAYFMTKSSRTDRTPSTLAATLVALSLCAQKVHFMRVFLHDGGETEPPTAGVATAPKPVVISGHC
jgi:hypothetical protein